MKKKNRFFWFILTIFFIFFVALYISSMSGYYESKINKKVVLTSKEIERFEQDVKEGKIVDVDSYIKTEKKDYSNKVSKFGSKVTSSVEVVITKGINHLIGILKTLFW